MIFEKFIEENLGHVSYLIADDDTKEAMIVDPKRDINDYITFIEKNNLKLKFILNTHTHADYIGGHLELVNIYPKAKNIFHKSVPANFKFLKVEDNTKLNLGKLSLKILHTPGHTPFCISCIINEDNIDKYIFTGDILFVGDIARPDLLGEELLENLLNMSYKSAKKLWELNDDMILFTSHIKGSLCGKNQKKQYFSTIGIEKKTNQSFILSQKSKNAYIDNLKSQNLETPAFFKKMAGININGPKLLNKLKTTKYLSKKQFFDKLKRDDFIIDLRKPNKFKKGFIKNSINVYEKSNISLIIGSLIDIDKRLFLVGDKKTNFKSVIQKLRRIGFDNRFFILNDKVDNIENLVKFKAKKYKKVLNLDTSKNIGDITCEISEIKNLNLDISYDVICQNGYKSMAVTSFLLKRNRE